MPPHVANQFAAFVESLRAMGIVQADVPTVLSVTFVMKDVGDGTMRCEVGGLVSTALEGDTPTQSQVFAEETRH